jgi:uncharacterized damage-inducible protein DinB
MLRTTADGLTLFRHEASQTARVLAEVTDAALDVRVSERFRSIGDLAWHIVVSQKGIGSRLSLEWDAPGKDVPRPPRAAQIHSAYVDGAGGLAAAIARQWTDASLAETVNVYGERWTKGHALLVLVLHEVHHRGQLTALMRHAGLRVPGVYGPSGDEKREP